MSVRDSEDINNSDNDLSQGDDVYDASYDDVDSTSEASDEWSDDEQADIDDGGQQEPAKKKKSKSTLFIVVGVVLFAIIGFIFLSGGSGNQEALQQVAEEAPVINAETNTVLAQPDANVQTQSVNTVAVENQPNSEVTAPQATEQTGILNDQNVVEKVENATEQNSEPIVPDQTLSQEKPLEAPLPDVQQEITPPQENPTQPVDAASQEPVKEATLVDVVTPNIKSVSDFPTADTIKKQEITQNNSADVPNEEEKPLSSPSQVALDEKDAKIGDIQNKLNEAQARITDLEKVISDKDATLVALNERKSDELIVDRTDEVEALKAKVSELEKRLADSIQTQDKEKISIANKESDDVSGSITNQSVSKKVKVSAQITPLRVKPSWTLKSATSTKAIIFNKETGDLKTVSVGDYIDGLGKIIDISQKNSAWVVKASKLSISE